MKKLIPLLLASALLAGCNIEIPEKVSIKTNAAYSFWAGNIMEQDFSEYLSVATISDMIPESGSIKPSVYDYNPNGSATVQKYLVNFPIMEVPIDIGAYLEDMDFADQLKDMSFNQTISIPKLSGDPVEYRQELELNKAINQNLAFTNLPEIPIPGEAGESLAAAPITVTISSASGNANDSVGYVKYASGHLVVTLEPNGTETPPSSFQTEVAATLINHNGKRASSDTVVTNGSNPIVIPIPLAGMELSSSFTLEFTGKVTGSGTAPQYTFSVSSKISEDAQIEEVNDITMSFDDAIKLEETIAKPGDDTFVRCTISEGELTVAADLPSGYEGIEFVPKIALVGGLNAASSEFADGGNGRPLDQRLNLAGKPFENEDIRLNGTIGIRLEHANITFNKDGSNSELIVKAEIDVESVESITVNFNELSDDKLHIDIEQEFPNDMQDFLHSITLENAGIDIAYTNTLPEGNDIDITADSELLNIHGNGKIESATPNGTASLTSKPPIPPITIADNPKIDFAVELKLPGTTAEQSQYVTLRNIELGEEYTISIDITPVFDWTKIVIKTDELKNVNGTIDTGINLKELFSDLASSLDDDGFIDSITISELPLYIYCTVPTMLDAFENVSFHGTFSANDEPLLDGLNRYEMAPTKLPALNPDENSMVTTSLSKEDTSFYSDIAELFNDAENTMSIAYDLQITGLNSEDGLITITRTEFDNNGTSESDSSTSISFVMRLEIPLELKVVKDISLDIKKLADIDDGDDLFSRSEETDISAVEEYIDTVEWAKIVYNVGDTFLKYSGTEEPMEIVLEDAALTGRRLELKLPAGGKNSEVTIQMQDLKAILQTCPFSPDLHLDLPTGTISVPREAKIGMKLGLQVKTNGTIPIYGQ